MSEDPKSDPSDRGEQPGKTRTLWHPLLARLLDFTLSSAYTVVPEVLVGKMPLRVDILLVRRDEGELSEAARREVSALLPLLNRFTLIEFKGPTDALERGDFAQLAGCAFLWHSQQSEPIPREHLSLVVLAPMVTGPFREELRVLGCELRQQGDGIYQVVGQAFTIWLVETDVMARQGEVVLSLVSRIFLKDRRRIIEQFAQTDDWVLLEYMLQYFQRVETLKEVLAMEFVVSSDDLGRMRAIKEDIIAVLLEKVPPERKLRGLTPRDRIAGMSDEEKRQLRELLEQEQRGAN